MSTQQWFVAASAAFALAAATYAVTWPVYTVFEADRASRATLLQVNGPWAAVPAVFPVFAALLPLAFNRQPLRLAAAVGMSAFSLVAMSIGFFYLPAAILMIGAACIPNSGATTAPPA